MIDIYERHKDAVRLWQMSCETVDLAEQKRDELRRALDQITIELTGMYKPAKQIKPQGRRGRKPKVNGLAEAHANARQAMIQNIKDLG